MPPQLHALFPLPESSQLYKSRVISVETFYSCINSNTDGRMTALEIHCQHHRGTETPLLRNRLQFLNTVQRPFY